LLRNFRKTKSFPTFSMLARLPMLIPTFHTFNHESSGRFRKGKAPSSYVLSPGFRERDQINWQTSEQVKANAIQTGERLQWIVFPVLHPRDKANWCFQNLIKCLSEFREMEERENQIKCVLWKFGDVAATLDKINVDLICYFLLCNFFSKMKNLFMIN